MNIAKASANDYINFLIATPKAYSCLEAARVQPAQANRPAHDAFTRLLHRLEPDAEALWTEAQTQVDRQHGILVIDDSTLDKPYARQIELVSRHWSGKHGAVVQGINLITLLWTDGERHIPCDYRLYDKDKDGLSKNDHFQAMLKVAYTRGFRPHCVVFDSWYASLPNLKLIRTFGWLWLTRLKHSRLVDLDHQGKRALSEWPLAETGTLVARRVGTVFKQRLLYGMTQLHPDEIRLEGVGHFLGRVMDADAVEVLSVSNGFAVLVALFQLLIAVVLFASAGGSVPHALILLLFLGALVGVGLIAWRAQRAWFRAYRQMTQDLAERMIRHRTRLAQEARSR